jgi:serine/threonine protein kinase
MIHNRLLRKVLLDSRMCFRCYQLFASAVALIFCSVVVEAWDPVWTAKSFIPDTDHPGLFLSSSTALNDADIKPPLQAAGKYGLPFLCSGPFDDATQQQALHSFFPLRDGSDVWTYAVSLDSSNPMIRDAASTGGPSSFVVGSQDGTAYFVSMCGLYNGSHGDIITSLSNSDPLLTTVWSSNTSVLRNASCQLVDVFDRVSLTRTSMIAIVGGVASSLSTNGSEGLVISFFELTSSVMHLHAITVPNISLASGSALHFPTLATASDGKLLIIGGVVTPANPQLPSHCSPAVSALVFYVDRHIGSFSATYTPLPLLPSEICADTPLTTAATMFSDSIYLSRVEPQSAGWIAQLELVSHLSWTVKALPGAPFNRRGATFFFSNLQREGSYLGLFAIGGRFINGTMPAEGAITAVRIESPVLPSYHDDPFTRGSALVTLSTPFAGEGGAATVTVTVYFILSNAGELGYIGLGTSPVCSNLVTQYIPYHGSEQAVISWNVTEESAGLGVNLYMCYSTANTVNWGSGESSTLFTVVNPTEPVFVTVPSFVIPPGTSPDGSTGFISKYWYYFALGGLGILTAAALIVSLIAFRRRISLRREFPSLIDPSTRTASGNFDPFASLRISTTSHSSRYVSVSTLLTMDGDESEVTFIVQRKSDGELFAMKNIPCDGDVERLLSIREFEALNVLQCHPNVVRCIDMFMSYAFSVKRFESQKSLSLPTSQIGSSRALSLNRDSKENVDVSEEEPEPEPVPRALTEGRYVCLVMEYHRNGNIAQFLVRLAQKNARQKPSSPTAPQRLTTEILDKLKPPPEKLLLCVAYQVVTLLKFMHYESEVSLSHKGLKPENILVCGDLNTQQTYFPVAVSDFGFSHLGNYAPPRTYRKRESDLESAASSTRSSATHGVNTDQMQSPKCDMWSLGCVLYALATYRFGIRFPPLAEHLTSALTADRRIQEIRTELRDRGYSKEFLFLVAALLSVDEATRPSSRNVHRMFARDHDGSFSLKPNPAAAAQAQSDSVLSFQDSTQQWK